MLHFRFDVLLSLAFLFAALPITSSSHDRYRMIFKKFTCIPHAAELTSVNCSINRVNHTHQSTNFEAIIKPGENLNSIWGRISVYHKPRFEQKFQPYIGVVNFTFDFCKYAKAEQSNAIIDMVLDDFKGHSNLFDPCPKKDRIYASNVIVSQKKFLSFMPFGEYMTTLDFFIKTKPTIKALVDTKFILELRANTS